MLFKKYDSNYKLLPEKPIKLEKDIQTIIESNLDVFFGVEFITSEFKVAQFRCDTFAFDRESKSFVVIEYKKKTDSGLFDQGLGYLELMDSRQADFLTEYNEKLKKHLLKKDIDIPQSKIIFISPSFNQSQRQAANFDVNIELWEIHLHDHIIELNKIHNSNKTQMPVRGSQAKIIEKFKPYTEEYHFESRAKGNKKIKILYEQFREKIMEFGEVQIIPRKYHIAVKANMLNFVAFDLRKSKLHIYVTLKKDDDPKKISKNVQNIGHWGTGNYQITVTDDSNFDYIFSLIKKSFEYTLNRSLSDIASDAVKTRKKNQES